MADLLPPPPQKLPKPLYQILPASSPLARLFDPTRFGATAAGFRSYGPIHRFDHHNTASDGTPVNNTDRRVLYAAPTLSSCIVEVFGDTSVIARSPYQVAYLTTTRDLHLLNLCGNGAMCAGTFPTISKDGRRPLTQEWARYFYENSAFSYNAQNINGLWYFNAHNDQIAVALFESAEAALFCGAIRPLNTSALQPILLAIANDHNMALSP